MDKYFRKRKFLNKYYLVVYIHNPSEIFTYQALGDFWNGRAGWYPTWQAAGEEAAIQVDYVRVWAL
jgi:hypothetical protein